MMRYWRWSFASSCSAEINRKTNTVVIEVDQLHLKVFLLIYFTSTVKVSVKENEVPTEKNSSSASIFATKASYISN